MANSPTRYFGLDIHKEYFVAVGVNAQREVVFGPQRVSNYQLDDWVSRVLTTQDAVVLEMTTNTYLFYDTLLPQVYSVIAVHPPSVALVTNAQVKTDKKAALALAQLHAAGMLHILHCVQDRLWTRNLANHPHIHYLVPGGGIASDRQSWLPANEGLPGRRDRW